MGPGDCAVCVQCVNLKLLAGNPNLCPAAKQSPYHWTTKGSGPLKWASSLPSWILGKFTDLLKVSVGLFVFGLSSVAQYLPHRAQPAHEYRTITQGPVAALQKMKAMTDTQNEVGGLVLKFTGYLRSAHMPLFNVKCRPRVSCQLVRRNWPWDVEWPRILALSSLEPLPRLACWRPS